MQKPAKSAENKAESNEKEQKQTENVIKSVDDCVLPADAVAIIWREEEGMVLLMPKGLDDAPVPSTIILLSAVFMRATQDAEWVEEMVEWFDTQMRTQTVDDGSLH